MGFKVWKTKQVYMILFLCLGILCVSCKSSPDPPLNWHQQKQEQKEQLLATYDQQFKEYLSRAQQEMGKTILTYEPISDQNTIPKYIKIEGTYYEYGYLVARISQQYGRQPQRIISDQRSFNNRIIEMYQNVYPQFLEIARGVGDLFGIPVNELDFIHFEDEFFHGLWWNLFKYQQFSDLRDVSGASTSGVQDHCALVSANIENNTFVGRNFDNDHLKPHFVVLTHMQGGYKVLANASYTIFHWIMDGINEKGLVMGTAANVTPPEYFWNDPYPDIPAIQQNHLFRIALETCANVDEVIALYSSVRPWSPHTTGHIMCADAQGNSAVIEFNTNRQPDFFKSDKDYQVLTNIAYHMGLDFMMSNCWRFERATHMAESGLQKADDVLNIMMIIRGTFGYTSIFDIKNRIMKDYFPSDLNNAFEFNLPDQ
jgi:hypothetical protein